MLTRLIKVIWIFLHASVSVSQAHFVTWTIDNGTIPDGFNETLTISWSRPASLTSCAEKCHRMGGCLTMSYIPRDSTCRLYGEEIMPDTILVPLYTTIQYFKALPCLRPDYIYEPDLGTCTKATSFTIWAPHKNASDTCQLHGGHLLVVNTTAAYDYMAQVIAETGITEFWTGGSRSLTNPEEYIWGNGDLIMLQNGGQFWLPWQPQVNSNNCISLLSTDTNGLGFRLEDCSKNKRFVCQRSPRWLREKLTYMYCIYPKYRVHSNNSTPSNCCTA